MPTYYAIPQAPSSNRTSGFPRYGSPTTFSISLSASKYITSTELAQTQSNKQAVLDSPCAPRSIAVFPLQEYSKPLTNKCVQFLESLHDRPGFSMIVVPASYNRIQDSYHIFQRFVISAAYRVSYLVLELLYRTIRWPNRTELLQLCILSACRTQPEMHSQKIESFAGGYYAGFVPM